MKLGAFTDLTVTQAREVARAHAGTVAKGGDPLDARLEELEKRKRLQQETVKAYLEGPYATYLSRRKGGKLTRQLIQNHFMDWLHKPMSTLTSAELSRWQAGRETAGKSWGTIRRAWDALRAMLNHAAKRGHIEANPLAGHSLERPALGLDELASAGSERRFLEPQEIKSLCTGIEAYQEQKRQERRNSRNHGKAFLPDLDGLPYADHVAPWILTMLYTGFRPGDLFGLRWEQVDLNFKNIRKTIEKTAHHKGKG